MFLFSTASRPALGPTQHSVKWITGAFSPGIQRLGHEANDTPLSSAEVKNCGAMHLLPHTSLTLTFTLLCIERPSCYRSSSFRTLPLIFSDSIYWNTEASIPFLHKNVASFNLSRMHSGRFRSHWDEDCWMCMGYIRVLVTLRHPIFLLQCNCCPWYFLPYLFPYTTERPG
jgi:hypothetical protein